jgi:hypothetical protein
MAAPRVTHSQRWCPSAGLSIGLQSWIRTTVQKGEWRRGNTCHRSSVTRGPEQFRYQWIYAEAEGVYRRNSGSSGKTPADSAQITSLHLGSHCSRKRARPTLVLFPSKTFCNSSLKLNFSSSTKTRRQASSKPNSVELHANQLYATIRRTTLVGGVARDRTRLAIPFGGQAAAVDAMLGQPIHHCIRPITG